MRLKFYDIIEVEGKTSKEIEWLITRAKTLASEFKMNKGENSGGRSERTGKKEKFIKFPVGKFTVQELANELGVSAPTIYQRLLKLQAAGDAKIVGELRHAGQRGRATAYWKVNPEANIEPDDQEFTKPRENVNVDLEDVVE